ncbi:MAG: hypothetical protein HY006_03065 [Candidatus Sungbacteria bacterium]|nr:hypothetical protein [Candidatus Sungbacteria bacterium]
MTNAKSIFDGFTGRYSLSKTLRFELRPIWNTQEMLDDKRSPVIEHDRVRHEKYKAMKGWLDVLHREFIEDSLRDFKFVDLKVYKSALEIWQKDKKSKQAKDTLVRTEADLREEIVNCFEKTANTWVTSEQYKLLGLKKEGIGILFEAGVFKLLKERFKDEGDVTIGGNTIFDDWNKWTGYFKKFFETRKNFYKSDDTSTAVAYRIVNQNLRRFCENMEVFKDVQIKGIDVSEVERNFGVSCADIFSLESYSICVLQIGIDNYNKIIGGKIRGKDKKIQGINELINKYRQDNPGKNIAFLKMLDKQIHSEKEAFIESIKTDAELIEKLRTFYQNADTKVQTFKKLIADIANDQSGYDLNKIYLSKEAIARNASRWFEGYESFERDLFEIVSEKQNKQEYESLRTHKDDSKISDKDGKLSFPDFIRCAHIRQALEKQKGRIWKERYYDEKNGIKDFQRIKDVFTQFLRVFQFELERQFFHKAIDAISEKPIEIDVGYDVFIKPIKGLITRMRRRTGNTRNAFLQGATDATVLAFNSYAVGTPSIALTNPLWMPLISKGCPMQPTVSTLPKERFVFCCSSP